MKQKKYRLIKDIDTPSFFVKSGSIAELVDGKYYILKGEKHQCGYNIKDVEDDTEWFEEVKEQEIKEVGFTIVCDVDFKPIGYSFFIKKEYESKIYDIKQAIENIINSPQTTNQ